MPKIFHYPLKNPLAPPPTYLMYVLLANFCCHEYGSNVSEEVQKISTRKLQFYAKSLKQLNL